MARQCELVRYSVCLLLLQDMFGDVRQEIAPAEMLRVPVGSVRLSIVK